MPETHLDKRPTLIGRSVVRGDARAKVTGQFEYGVDVSLPGMLHAKVRRSEIQHGLLRRVDITRALAIPGVHAVLTGADVKDCLASRFVRDEPILAVDRVRYHGEPIPQSFLQGRRFAFMDSFARQPPKLLGVRRKFARAGRQ